MLRIAAGVPVPRVAGLAAAAPDGELRYPLIKQKKDNWCWAACIQMIEQGRSVPMRDQCDIANATLGLTVCCSGGSGCDETADAAQISRQLSRTFPGSSESPVPRLADLVRELTLNKKAVLVGWRWRGGARGHVVLVHGVVGAGANLQFLVRDPQPESGLARLSYDGLIDANGGGSWVNAWIRL